LSAAQGGRVAFVLCEGLYGYNNADLYAGLQIQDKLQQQVSVFSCANGGRKLGDTANDLFRLNDSTFIIIVSGSNEVHKLNNRNGKVIATFFLEGQGHFLRKGCKVNDSLIAITDLYSDCVYLINTDSMKIQKTITGEFCAPDGISYSNAVIAICNSGYGIFRYKDKYAGSITFVDLQSGKLNNIYAGTNVQKVVYSSTLHSWFAVFTQITNYPDSLGGLIQIKADDYTRIRSWPGRFTSSIQLSLLEDTLFCVNDKALSRIPLRKNSAQIEIISIPDKFSTWYQLSSTGIAGQLIVSDARTYTVQGRIILLNTDDGRFLGQTTVGINPGAVLY
jgi:hypothetical protein